MANKLIQLKDMQGDSLYPKTYDVIDKNQNGYCKLSGGLIVQWGWTTITGGSQITVIYPITFSYATSYCITAMSFYNNSPDGYCTLSDKESSSCILRLRGVSVSNKIYWIAVGG